MCSIYLYEGEYGRGEEGYGLVLRALAMYMGEADTSDVEILKDEKGKPYFRDIPVELSISHSRDMWMCMLAGRPCGIDIQERRDVDYLSLARRFFAEEAARRVEEAGEDEFFRIWVRREAFCKMTGEGFFAPAPSCIEPEGEFRGMPYAFTDIDIGSGIYCSFVTPEPSEYTSILL